MTTLFISHSSKDKAWAERTHAALAQDYQCLFLDSHPDDGIHAGADWEKTLYQRLRQSHGLVVLCSANWLASPWCVAEAMMARERGKRVFLMATADVADDRQVKSAGDENAPRIPDFLKDKQFISLSSLTEEEVYRQLLNGLEKEGLKKKDFERPDRPYPGLAPFQETDAAVYFGRDGEIDEVIATLNRRRRSNARGFILVLGASGCGKSSLVRAGVLPRLRRMGDADGKHTAWVIVPPFMGGKGRHGLTLSLAHAFNQAGQPRGFAAIYEQLGALSDVRTLANELLLAHGATEGSVLLVLDQLEEVFGRSVGSEAGATLRLLLDTSTDVASPLVVLATTRSDFLNAFQLFEGTAERYEKVTLDPMPRSRFAEVIEGPADRFGLDLDPGLAERMAAETAYNDALPLLAFTLEKLYETCKAGRRLTVEAYNALGGVDASVKHVANAILKEAGYASLPADDSCMRDLRRAFYRLAQVGEEGQFTRRIARWSQMPTSCEVVLKRFVDQRLLVSGRDEQGEATLTVAHEALFRVWDTLNSWLQADRKALVLRAQIEDAATEWQDANRVASRAWGEERVLDAVRVIEESGVSLDDVKDPATVKAFLGPTDPEDIKVLPALDATADATKGSGRYGDAWQLPLSHEARASVGVRLALRDDCREGVGLRADGLPDIDWVDIDGGGVRIEIRPDTDPNTPPVKILSCFVESFRMARFPITIVQFQAFLKEYENGNWQLPPGNFRLPDGYYLPRLRGHYLNHPADGVNWYDSMIFCAWLSARLGFDVRLPTEFEWQLAAVGSDAAALDNWQLRGGLYLPGPEPGPKKEYPWGAGWDPEQEPWRANTQESGLGRPTAVGMYPAGASPAGVLDMAGTVYEWCLSPFSNSEDSYPVLRGGSCITGHGNARSIFRFANNPRNRAGTFGFRVVCSSPSTGH